MRAALVVINVIFDDTEDREVNGHDHQGKDPSDCRDESADQRADHAGAAAGQKSNEGEGASDRVEDHGVGEAVDSVLGGFAELGT